MSKKAIFVFGAERTGGRFAAKLCAHALAIKPFGVNPGAGKHIGSNGDFVMHRSLPYMDCRFPDADAILEDYRDHDMRFVFSIREMHISEFSRFQIFPKPGGTDQIKQETEIARQFISRLMERCKVDNIPFFLFSYETAMYLKCDYLNLLYEFVGAPECTFMPELSDSNFKHLCHFYEGWEYKNTQGYEGLNAFKPKIERV